MTNTPENTKVLYIRIMAEREGHDESAYDVIDEAFLDFIEVIADNGYDAPVGGMDYDYKDEDNDAAN